MKNTIGEKLSPVLVEIEETLWENEIIYHSKPNYPIEGFRASVKIFTSVMFDKILELQEKEKMNEEDSVKMGENFGNDLRNLIKTYANIDTFDLFKKVNMKTEKELENTDFDKNTIASKLNLSGVIYGSPLHELITNLNVNLSGNRVSTDSIMMYGTICSCDDYYMCEHRLQWILDFIKKNNIIL